MIIRVCKLGPVIIDRSTYCILQISQTSNLSYSVVCACFTRFILCEYKLIFTTYSLIVFNTTADLGILDRAARMKPSVS